MQNTAADAPLAKELKGRKDSTYNKAGARSALCPNGYRIISSQPMKAQPLEGTSKR